MITTKRLNRKLLLISFFYTTIACSLYSQQFEPFFSFGYGSYKMEDLKKFQDDIISQVPFPLKITDNFPSYVNYRIGLMYHLENGQHKVGLSFGNMSTGSRANVTDYSGSYNIDQKVKASQYGVVYEGLLSEFYIFQLAFNANVGYLATSYKLVEEFEIGQEYMPSDVASLASSGFYIEPGLKLSVPFHKFVFSVQTGYMFDSASPLHLESDKDLELQLEDRSIGADFSGVRLNAVIAFIIG
ncbi:hypothetical protein [Labilibacter marinus]|uniref:hypothetical protein n=1 Tax=Labilibacter marinus TaxID=1477105 RepID=UPI000833D81B|nr:hypothetical protein [Labilibacter marinus]